MIYITAFDKGDKQRIDFKMTLTNKKELDWLRETLKKTHGCKQINFIYYEK